MNGNNMKYLHVIIMALAALCVCTAIFACSTVKYVPVESVKLDSVYFNKYERDSIYIKDSVFVYSSSDTVFLNRWHNVYRDRIVRDTLYKSVCDTTTVVRTVEREFTKFERLKMDVGAGVLFAIPIILCLYILYRRLKK